MLQENMNNIIIEIGKETGSNHYLIPSGIIPLLWQLQRMMRAILIVT